MGPEDGTVARLDDARTIGEGAFHAYTVHGTSLVVARVRGKLYAFSDTCTHEACSLSEGDLTGPFIKCPCHGSQFDVRTGSAIAGPATEPLTTFRVEEAVGELRVVLRIGEAAIPRSAGASNSTVING
jgi:3-phenylpropionate/trans-cinnamate dioxygenase ferredoxin subunit